MNRKIVKIIVVIIFTLIFKLDMVDAATDKDYTCTYSQPGGTVYEGFIKIDIENDNVKDAIYSNSIRFVRDNKKISIKDKNNFKKEEKGCPQNIYFISNSEVSRDFELYFSYEKYSKRTEDIKKKNCPIDGTLCMLAKDRKFASFNLNSSSYVAKGFKGGDVSCECSKSKFKFSYLVYNNSLTVATLEAPKSILGNVDAYKKFNYIQNFDKRAIIALGFNKKTTVNYMYLNSEELNANKCSKYVILQKGTWGLDFVYELFFSDENHKSEFITALSELPDDPEILTCNVAAEPIEPEPKDIKKEEKYYDDADVNMVVTPLNFSLDTYSCGNGFLESIPVTIPVIGRIVYLVVQILVPIILILLGSLDLVKAVIGQKDDEIKKNQQVFMKRLIGAALIFFVFAIVKFVISIVSSDNSGKIMDCVDCIIRNSDNCKRE